jgi:hypothetical protein
MAPSRRSFFAMMTALGLGSEPFLRELYALATQAPQGTPSRVTAEMVRNAVQLAGLKYTEAEQQGMVASLNRILTRAEELHLAPPDNGAPTPLLFDPRVPGFPVVVPARVHRPAVAPRQTRPSNLDDLAFRSIPELADLVRRRVISSVELTEMYLRRLERYNPSLNCVVNLTADRAMVQAREMDAELARGLDPDAPPHLAKVTETI